MELYAQAREVLGKKVKSLRNNGFIPAEFYGHGFENKHLSVLEKDFIKIYKEAGENTVLTLVVDGEKTPVIISHVDEDYLSGKFLSVNLRGIKKDEEIRTHIPIEFTGTDVAAKNGLLLVKVLDEVEIEALPDNIPHQFTIDITPLERVGQSISVKDVVIKNVKVLSPEETIIAIVKEKEEEKEEPAKTEEPAGEKKEEEKKPGEEKK